MVVPFLGFIFRTQNKGTTMEPTATVSALLRGEVQGKASLEGARRFYSRLYRQSPPALRGPPGLGAARAAAPAGPLPARYNWRGLLGSSVELERDASTSVRKTSQRAALHPGRKTTPSMTRGMSMPRSSAQKAAVRSNSCRIHIPEAPHILPLWNLVPKSHPYYGFRDRIA